MLMASSPAAAYQDWDLSSMQNKLAMDTRVKKYEIFTNNLSKMLASVNNLYMDPRFSPYSACRRSNGKPPELDNALFLWCFNALCLVDCRPVSSQDGSSTGSYLMD
jgi:hypothetical protein